MPCHLPWQLAVYDASLLGCPANRVPVEDLRQQLRTIAEASPLWDQKVCGLQVTNLSERTMELRCLVSSRNSSQNFDSAASCASR
jgi:hypothetical protein